MNKGVFGNAYHKPLCPDMTWIVTKSLSDEWSVHGNLGYTRVGDPDGEDLGDIVHFGIATECQTATMGVTWAY